MHPGCHGGSATTTAPPRPSTGSSTWPPRLDLGHPDPLYEAGKADQLARAASDLAHDLRVLTAAQRLRRHLIDQHHRADLAGREQNADVWACDHAEDHHAGVPAGTSHSHPDVPPWAW